VRGYEVWQGGRREYLLYLGHEVEAGDATWRRRGVEELAGLAESVKRKKGKKMVSWTASLGAAWHLNGIGAVLRGS
jgi:hypothetical protein